MYLERGGIRRRLERRTRRRWGVQELSGDVRTVGSRIGQALRWTEVWYVDFPVSQGGNGEERDVGKGPCVSGGTWLWRCLQERHAQPTDVPEQGNLVRNYSTILLTGQ